MCNTCGCNSTHNHTHIHTNEKRVIDVNKDILHNNNLLAERIRGYCEGRNIFSLNIVSSPGAGKTTLLEKTIRSLKKDIEFFVIAGDQQTTNDAKRIEETGAKTIQINTGSGCHLDANMVHNALQKLDPSFGSVLMIENVGNLVCPALFDLGEKYRVVVISVTEGEDKPLKYPNMFESSNICIINKTDLLPHLDFDIEKLRINILKVNHHIKVIELSAITEDGINEWHKWIKDSIKE